MKLSSKLPEGNDNGLVALWQAMETAPESQHVIVALVDCCRLTTDIDTGDVTPTARILKVEAVTDTKRAQEVRTHLQDARARRSGQTSINLITGEVLGGDDE